MDIITSPIIFFGEKAHPTISPMTYSQALHINFGKGNHSHKSFQTLKWFCILSVHVSLLDPTTLSHQLPSCSFCRPMLPFLLPPHLRVHISRKPREPMHLCPPYLRFGLILLLKHLCHFVFKGTELCVNLVQKGLTLRLIQLTALEQYLAQGHTCQPSG